MAAIRGCTRLTRVACTGEGVALPAAAAGVLLARAVAGLRIALRVGTTLRASARLPR